MSRPILAAITTDRRGGGVAGVARLLWQVLGDEWGSNASSVTLTHRSDLRPTIVDRLVFGARVTAAQMTGRSSWILYSHLRLARAQAMVPSAFARPYAIFLHGIEAWRPLRAGERRALEGASLLLANSAYTARRIGEAHPWLGPIAACPLALPPRQDAAAGDDDVDVALGPHAVLVVARMSAAERYKGHDQLIDAWPSVVARVPDAELVFVGTGDDVPRLKQRVSQMGLDASVRFPGFVSDATLDRLYGRAAAFAMPSRDEGLGLVYLEAMSHGLPCLGSIHDAATEVIDDGLTGYLVDQADTVTMGDRLASMLLDDAARRQMGARGYARWQQRFGYEQFRDRLLALTAASFGRPAPHRVPSVPAAGALRRSRP